jgi:TPR repeat protein
MSAFRHFAARHLALALAAALPIVAAATTAREPAPEDTVIVESGAVEARALPDLKRGQLAAAEDRTRDAEADLRPLAERGYVEAQIALGKLYARIGTPERVNAAIVWLRAAERQAPLPVQVPLGRLLARSPNPNDQVEAQGLLNAAYTQRKDSEALAGLVRLYTEHAEVDKQQQVAQLAQRAEKISQPDTLSAASGWYRSTPQIAGHPQHLLELCHRAIDVVPECHIDLARDARRRGDHKELDKLVDESIVAYDRALLSETALTSLARVLIDDPKDDANDPIPHLSSLDVRVSDVEEDEGEAALRQTSSERSQQSPGCSGPSLPVAAKAPADAAPAAAPATPVKEIAAEPELASKILQRLLQGQGLAPVLAAGVVVRYPYLLPGSDIEATLKKGDTDGIAESRLYLGTLYLQGARSVRDPRRTLQYLKKAQDDPATSLQAHYFLGRLYQYGYLDESSPLLASQHLIYAARHGYNSADGAIARLFSGGKGLCPNLVDAYVFARLAVDGGSDTTAPLLDAISAQLSPQQTQQAQQRLSAERAARPNAAAGAYAQQAPSRSPQDGQTS